jgi:hypothetical protein
MNNSWIHSNRRGIVGGKPDDPSAILQRWPHQRWPPRGGRRRLLVANDTAGVWIVCDEPLSAAEFPLSLDWKKNQMSSHALGVNGGEDMYAGGDVLMETDMLAGAAAPLLGCNEILIDNAARTLPLSGHIFDILVLQEKRVIVLRASTAFSV